MRIIITVFKMCCFLETLFNELRLMNAYHYYCVQHFRFSWNLSRGTETEECLSLLLCSKFSVYFYFILFFKPFSMNWDWRMLIIITVITVLSSFASSSLFYASLTYWRWQRHPCPLSRLQPSGIQAALPPGHPGYCPPPHPLRPVLRVRRHACAEPPGLGGAAARVSLPLRLQQQRQEVRAAGPRSVWH